MSSCTSGVCFFFLNFTLSLLIICIDKCRTPRSNFVLHHTEPSGHKFYQSQQETTQSQYQQQQQQPIAV